MSFSSLRIVYESGRMPSSSVCLLQKQLNGKVDIKDSQLCPWYELIGQSL